MGLMISIPGFRVPDQNWQNDVNLEISSGHIVGILGESGVGKTTLVETIAGFNKNTAKVTDGSTPLDLTSIQYVPQQTERYLLPWKSVEKHIQMASVQMDDNAGKLVQGIGLSDHLEQRPHQLSGGQQKRLALLLALIRRPKLVIIDEAFGSFDSVTSQRCFEILKCHIRNHEAHAIIVTHDSAFSKKLDSLYTLSSGGTLSVANGSTSE